EGEGPATQLLAKLVERIEAIPVPSPEAGSAGKQPRPSRRLPWLAAALVGLGLVGAIVYMAIQAVNKQVNVGTAVSVQVEMPKAVQDAAVVLILDGKEVSKEDLARPVPLQPGEHELVTKTGNKVVETRKFTVGKEDKTVHPFDSPEVEASPEVKTLIDR